MPHARHRDLEARLLPWTRVPGNAQHDMGSNSRCATGWMRCHSIDLICSTSWMQQEGSGCTGAAMVGHMVIAGINQQQF
eukprot:6474265-Amphidinium_carterae.1